MQLNEHLSKLVLAAAGVPCCEGVIAKTPGEAAAAAASIGYPVVVKAQVPASGRARAGGIRRVGSPGEVRAAFAAVTAAAISGLRATEVRVEPWTRPRAEYFLAVTVSAEHLGPVLLFNPGGGTGVETSDGTAVMPLREDGTVNGAALRRAAYQRGVPARLAEKLAGVARALGRAYSAFDARLVELNPLGVFDGERLTALDARVVVDDNALFRQPQLAGMARASTPRRVEDVERETAGLEYVPLPGSIGLVSGGAGMTLAVMDLLAEQGAAAACFLDCSANPTRRGYGRGLQLIAENPRVNAVLVSIFGGLTLVDKVAVNLVEVLREQRFSLPVTFRLMGAHVDGADRVLAGAGFRNHRRLDEAVSGVIAQARSVGGSPVAVQR